jgi:hypothetical protein
MMLPADVGGGVVVSPASCWPMVLLVVADVEQEVHRGIIMGVWAPLGLREGQRSKRLKSKSYPETMTR